MTKYVAIDCEFDQGKARNIPCKVSIVNYDGEIILDTLVDNKDIRVRSHVEIHGISDDMLLEAPSFAAVKAHVLSLCRDCTFIGHSVKQDLKVMEIAGVNYIDTALAIDSKQPKKLKEVAKQRLNASIQEGTHSSIVDARTALAIFRDDEQFFTQQIYFMTEEDLKWSVSKYQHKHFKPHKKERKGAPFPDIMTDIQMRISSQINL